MNRQRESSSCNASYNFPPATESAKGLAARQGAGSVHCTITQATRPDVCDLSFSPTGVSQRWAHRDEQQAESQQSVRSKRSTCGKQKAPF